MTQHAYTPWLSGHCLLLLTDELSPSQRDDALNVQLFAWLKANEEGSVFVDDGAWHAEYDRVQQQLGWPFGYTEHKNGAARPGTPLRLLAAPMLNKVPQSHHAALEACVEALQGLPETAPALQALRAEAVQDATVDTEPPLNRLVCELRVVHAPGHVVSSSLYLETRQPLERQWLGQALEVEPMQDLRTRLCCGEVHESAFATVRSDLRQLLSQERLAYTSPIGTGVTV